MIHKQQICPDKMRMPTSFRRSFSAYKNKLTSPNSPAFGQTFSRRGNEQ